LRSLLGKRSKPPVGGQERQVSSRDHLHLVEQALNSFEHLLELCRAQPQLLHHAPVQGVDRLPDSQEEKIEELFERLDIAATLYQRRA
jgi:hypothetical protein